MSRKPIQFTSQLWSVNSETGCWEWLGPKWRGYGRFGKSAKAHRASWIHHRGEIPDGLHILHECDNRACVNPEHLFLGTNSDNVTDKVSKGRQVRGKQFARTVALARSRQGKLRPEDIAKLVELSSSMKQKDIAAMLGVDRSYVSRVLSKQRAVQWQL